MSVNVASISCPLCGHEHRIVALARGESAVCLRCDTVIVRRPRFGRDGTLAFTLTGLVLAVPALLLPFVTAGKFGQERGGLLFTGVEGLWQHDMRLLAIWVLLCGALVPLLLLSLLAGVLIPERLGWSQTHGEFLSRAAHALSYWAMPEVQVLAVLVALLKLGSLVDVAMGAGFWSYGGMSFCLLVAWRSFTLLPPTRAELMPEGNGPVPGSPAAS